LDEDGAEKDWCPPSEFLSSASVFGRVKKVAMKCPDRRKITFFQIGDFFLFGVPEFRKKIL
jgi:hypothetical protein